MSEPGIIDDKYWAEQHGLLPWQVQLPRKFVHHIEQNLPDKTKTTHP